MKKNGKKTLASVALYLVLFFCISAQGPTVLAQDWECDCEPSLCEAYKNAVADAAGPLTLDKISTTLTAIIPENKKLIWEDDDENSRLLVVIYSWGLNPDPGTLPNPTYSLQTNKWVTVAPELYDFFKTRTFTDTRIEQLLGLPPCYGNTKIIELYIDPLEMFRPAMDPETTDSETSLEFPWIMSTIVTYDANTTVYDDFCETTPCFSDYETWYTNRRAGVYSASPPYPWTGMGYTYDWRRRSGRGRSSGHVGLSEFVVVPSTVGILRISDATDYFRIHKHNLFVSKIGDGKVTSRKKVINCGKKCAKSFKRYTKVILTAKPASNATFSHWEGACAHAGSDPACTVTMVDDKSVTAVFEGE